MLHNRGKQSTASHNNGWGKSRKLVLNRQESSVSHNQDKQSSVLHNRDWGSSVLHNRDKGSSVSHNNGWGKSRNQVLSRQESSVLHNRDKRKLCVAQSGQGEALCYITTAGKRAGTRF